MDNAVARIDTRSLAQVERHITPTALVLPDGLTYDEWAKYSKGLNVSRLMVSRGSLLFYVGDWLAYGERNIGEAYAQAIEDTGYDAKTLYQAKWVSGSIPPSRRREELSWTHHKVVAGLAEPDQDYLLDLAVTDHLTSNQLKRMAAAVKMGVADAEVATNGGAGKEDAPLPSPEETQNYVSSALESLRRDIPIATEIVDSFLSQAGTLFGLLNDDAEVRPEDSAKLQATAKSLSEITGRIAHTIYALL